MAASSSRARAAPHKGAQASKASKQSPARKRSTKQDSSPDLTGKSAAELRDALTEGVIAPLDLVMLTRERIEDTMSDAVARGRMTAEDARQLAQGLIERGQQQTSDVLRDLEQLLGRGRSELEDRAEKARKAADKARSRASKAADPVRAHADRARRVAGVGPSFPISGYEDLTVAQVQSRLGDLSPPELRKVRDHERRNANRKSVLTAIEKRLA